MVTRGTIGRQARVQIDSGASSVKKNAEGSSVGGGVSSHSKPELSSRLAALTVLNDVYKRDSFANLDLPQVLHKYQVTGQNAHFATEIVYGTLRWKELIDRILKSAGLSSAKTSVEVLNICRIGTYQILFMDTPAYAAVTMSVNMAHHQKLFRQKSFINVILRKISTRTLQEWQSIVVSQVPKTQGLQRLSIRYSHPEWIIEKYQRSLEATYDKSHGDELLVPNLVRNNEPPSVTLCIRPSLITREELIEQLPKDAQWESTHYSPLGVKVKGVNPKNLPAVKNGSVGVEDEGSQIAALSLVNAPLKNEVTENKSIKNKIIEKNNVAENNVIENNMANNTAGNNVTNKLAKDITGKDTCASQRWLDMCAGPGGKSAVLASYAQKYNASLTLNEIAPHRLELVKENVRAFTDSTIERFTHVDGREYAQKPYKYGFFDKILVDAPCSGLGVIRRRPEARWRKNEEDIKQLCQLQYELLCAAIEILKPGGVVAYVTCSPTIEETRDVVEKICRDHSFMEHLDSHKIISTFAPEVVKGQQGLDTQLWEVPHDTDMMFISLLRKIN